MIKPFCDGTHKLTHFDEPPKQHTNQVDGPTSPNFSNQQPKEKIAMTESQEPTTDAADDSAKEQAKREDHVSDPALSTEPGHDWSDEGGATEDGPVIDTSSSE